MLPKVFKELEAKQSIVVQYDQVTQPILINKWGVHFNDRAFRISIMAELIVETLFMLFSIYNAV